MFRESDVFQDVEWERQFCYKDIEVPDVYGGPHLSFPLTVSTVTELVDAFKNKQVQSFQSLTSVNENLAVFNCSCVSVEASRTVCAATAGQDLDASALDAQHQSRVQLQTHRDHHLW